MRHYDQIALTYDRQYRQEQEAKIQAALENLSFDQNAVVLDAGCGTGLLFNHIPKRAKLTVGIDISLALLKQAKTKVSAKTALIRADADHTPFKANTFTHTFAFTLIQNTPNPAETLNDLKRVTKPNAPIIITGLKKHFTKESFIKHLENINTEIITLRTDEKLKDYIAVCRKRL